MEFRETLINAGLLVCMLPISHIALAGPAQCTPGNQDATCVSPITYSTDPTASNHIPANQTCPSGFATGPTLESDGSWSYTCSDGSGSGAVDGTGSSASRPPPDCAYGVIPNSGGTCAPSPPPAPVMCSDVSAWAPSGFYFYGQEVSYQHFIYRVTLLGLPDTPPPTTFLQGNFALWTVISSCG